MTEPTTHEDYFSFVEEFTYRLENPEETSGIEGWEWDEGAECYLREVIEYGWEYFLTPVEEQDDNIRRRYYEV